MKKIKNQKVVIGNGIASLLLVILIYPNLSMDYLLHQFVILGFLAFGLAVEMLSGVLDFAFVSEIVVTTFIGVQMIQSGSPFLVVIPVILCLQMGMGAVKGWMIGTFFVNHPILLTLILQRLLKGCCSYLDDNPQVVILTKDFYNSPVFWVVMLLLLAGLGMALAWGLSKTYYGRYIRMLGEDETAVRNSGMNVKGIRMVICGLSGLFYGIAAVILLLITSGGGANTGNHYLYPAIAAVCLGGMNFLNGTGQIRGVIGGTVTVVLLMNLFAKWNIYGYYAYIVEVILILIAVVIFTRQKKN